MKQKSKVLGFLRMLLGTLSSGFVTDMLLNKKGKGVIRAEERKIRAGYGYKSFDSPPTEKL